MKFSRKIIVRQVTIFRLLMFFIFRSSFYLILLNAFKSLAEFRGWLTVTSTLLRRLLIELILLVGEEHLEYDHDTV